MTQDNAGIAERILQTSNAACQSLDVECVSAARLDDVLSNSIDPARLVNSLAEAWRTTPERVKSILQEHGFGGLLARLGVDAGAAGGDEPTHATLSSRRRFDVAERRFSVQAIGPTFDVPVACSDAVWNAVDGPFQAFLAQADNDPLGVLYRKAPLAYAQQWLKETAPRIDAYVREQFGDKGPAHVVNSGIGANEMFNYFVSELANGRPDKHVAWHLANSPKEIARLPAECTLDNTLFMEFSRSGITEETIKLHECTPREAKRIVFANSGPLKQLGERDGNLVLALPSEVSGRYGRNKTPILMAPMHVCGLDVAAYWSQIEAACAEYDFNKADSLPATMARYIRIQQLRRGVDHIYFGVNDDRLIRSADEFCQYWNEGVNRDGNDITMSRYLGLPRDSHMNLEAMLGTSEHKLAVFLVRTGEIANHPLLRDKADAIDPAHRDLSPADVDRVLALANVQRCSEKMPTILIAVDRIDLTTTAWLGQLWADTTLAYSRLIGVDPGSNPEVKAVRTRAASLLADPAAASRILA